MIKTKFKKEYIKDGTSRYGCQYLISFCTKYKRNIFEEEDLKALRTSFSKTAEKYGFIIHEMELKENQVTLIVECNPLYGIQNAVIKLKKESKDYLKEVNPSFKTRIPCIWTRETFISTVGTVSESTINKFVEEQENYIESISRIKNKEEK